MFSIILNDFDTVAGVNELIELIELMDGLMDRNVPEYHCVSEDCWELFGNVAR